MENAAVKTLSHSSNLSEIISKFAKVCKFRSIGVFPDQKSNSKDVCEVEILVDNDKAKEIEICDFNHKPSSKIRTLSCDDVEISKLFDLVSALKLAYVEFQQAHLPYDPDKIIEADNLVVSQLEALRRIKRLYLKIRRKFWRRIRWLRHRLFLACAFVMSCLSAVATCHYSFLSILRKNFFAWIFDPFIVFWSSWHYSVWRRHNNNITTCFPQFHPIYRKQKRAVTKLPLLD